MDNGNLLALQEITKTFPQNGTDKRSTVLHGINLNLKQGGRIGITGASGSGKTTLLHLIAGLEEPDSGRILIDGKAVTDKGSIIPPHKRGIGYVFQTSALWPHMTVEENIRYPARNGKIDLDGFMDAFEISDIAKRYPSQISGGQARRAAIVRAFASGAKLILMDEPMSSLDSGLKTNILKVLAEHLERTQTGLVYVTHDEGELPYIAAQCYRIAGGGLCEVR